MSEQEAASEGHYMPYRKGLRQLHVVGPMFNGRTCPSAPTVQ
jgi:hypothetical protein